MGNQEYFAQFFARTEIREQDAEAVLGALRSGDISFPHGVTHRLETSVQDYLGTDYALAHCNGSSAMLAAMFGCGVRKGDEVICPSYTWWASISPAVMLGARPVFCEVKPDNLTLDPQDVASKITVRTKAIIVPHLWGNYADVFGVKKVADDHSKRIRIIEDISHSLGARINDDFLGTFGDAAIFSLQDQKILSAGEGGMLVTDDREVYEYAIYLGHYERLKELQNSQLTKYAKTGGGFKFRIHPLGAALALSQFKTLDARIEKQDQLTSYFESRLEKIKVIDLYNYNPAGFRRGGVINLKGGISTPDKVQAQAERELDDLYIKKEFYPLLHREPFFTGINAKWNGPNALPRTEAIYEDLYSFPVFADGNTEVVDDYTEKIRQVLARYIS